MLTGHKLRLQGGQNQDDRRGRVDLRPYGHPQWLHV